MKLKVPYYSQKIDVKDPGWKDHGCGITCLKMVLDFHAKESVPSVDDLIQEGISMDGLTKEYNWKHDALVNIARNYGLHAYKQEFKSHTFDISEKKFHISKHEDTLTKDGIKKIVSILQTGLPVIVSAIKKFKHTDKFHMVVLVGIEGDESDLKGFYYHDPDAESVEEGKNQFVDMETFKTHWRKMAIFSGS
ncbi:MAG: hypothetical protein BMS9Abin13_238 [Patescibacteria group bacterium]|nr:MAG: hypothetical protein BMS9Abin13_238 [Patescibacteria group bacterium]